MSSVSSHERSAVGDAESPRNPPPSYPAGDLIEVCDVLLQVVGVAPRPSAQLVGVHVAVVPPVANGEETLDARVLVAVLRDPLLHALELFLKLASAVVQEAVDEMARSICSHLVASMI